MSNNTIYLYSLSHIDIHIYIYTHTYIQTHLNMSTCFLSYIHNLYREVLIVYVYMRTHTAFRSYFSIHIHKNTFYSVVINSEHISRDHFLSSNWKETHFYVYLSYTLNLMYKDIYIYIYIYISKVGDHSRGWPEGSLFDSYYTKVYGRALLLPSIASLYPWSIPYNAEC